MIASLKNPVIREQFSQLLEREQRPRPVWVHALGDGVGAVMHDSKKCQDLLNHEAQGFQILKLRATKDDVLIDDIGVSYAWKGAYSMPCTKCRFE